jgi:large subunit ribosomal protein L24
MEKTQKCNKKICKGDKVYVISGNERGHTGTVLEHLGDRIVVQGMNIRKKSVKKSEQNQRGGYVEREASMDISNVRLFVAEGKPAKVKVKTDKHGHRQLVYKDGKKDVVYRDIKKRTT